MALFGQPVMMMLSVAFCDSLRVAVAKKMSRIGLLMNMCSLRYQVGWHVKIISTY